MKIADILLACGDIDSGIFAHIAATASKRGARGALGLCEGGCVTGITYERLVGDSMALAGLISERSPAAVLLHGGNAREAALFLLASSLLEIPLILCSENAKVDAIEATVNACGALFSVSEVLKGRDLALSELSAAIEVGRSEFRVRMPDFRGSGFLLSFFSERGLESYSEDSVLHLACEYGMLSSYVRSDVTLSDLAPLSPEGVVCALLAPLLTGGTAAFIRMSEEVEAYSRIVRPTRLLCGAETASGAIAAVKREERGGAALPIVYSPKKRGIFAIFGKKATLAKRRRLYSGRLMRLGGRLRHVTLTDDTKMRSAQSFSELGIVTGSLLSTYGCPFVGIRTVFSPLGAWRLPGGLFADVCGVGKGGVGRLTLSGRGLCISSDNPIKRGCIPGSFRLDDTDGLSLVTDFCGYVLPNGNICVKKRLKSDFFCKSPCNSGENIL